ncbi:hypothetical protein [Geopseudomonas aromaticivorans]
MMDGLPPKLCHFDWLLSFLTGVGLLGFCESQLRSGGVDAHTFAEWFFLGLGGVVIIGAVAAEYLCVRRGRGHPGSRLRLAGVALVLVGALLRVAT